MSMLQRRTLRHGRGPARPVAERVESTVSQEHAKWASVQQQAAAVQATTPPAA